MGRRAWPSLIEFGMPHQASGGLGLEVVMDSYLYGLLFTVYLHVEMY